MIYSLSRTVINFTHSHMLQYSGRSWLLVARTLTASKMLNKIANSTSTIPSTSHLPTATRLQKEICNLKISCEVHWKTIAPFWSYRWYWKRSTHPIRYLGRKEKVWKNLYGNTPHYICDRWKRRNFWNHRKSKNQRSYGTDRRLRHHLCHDSSCGTNYSNSQIAI